MKRLLCTWLLASALPLAHAEPVWLPLRDPSLMIQPGSILDFSALAPGAAPLAQLQADGGGHLVRQDEPGKPRRFLMASLGFSAATGYFPDHAAAERYVQQIRLRGYNMIRLDFVEDTLIQGRSADFDFNPEQLDRFHYLLAALKREGIYFMLNGLSSDNGAYGNLQKRWENQRQAKLRVYYDPEAQQHWKKLIDRMLGTVNPYTKLSTLADPALAGLIVVNEGGLEFVNRGGSTPELKQAFAAWLKQKYGGTAQLAKAWNGELKAGENLDGSPPAFPKTDAWTSRRMADTQRFYVELEKSTSAWMTQYLRRAGYKGLITAYNNWLSPAAHLARAQYDWIDLHNYFSEPTGFVSSGSKISQDSMLAGGAKYIVELAAGQQLGKPYTVSEFGQVFWNKYRRESSLALPAYAALQGWDVIAQHGGALVLSYAEAGGRKDRIYPFMVATDPVNRATETLAALLYLRGDVAEARNTVAIPLDPGFIYDDNAFYGNIPPDLSRLALVSRIGLEWREQPVARGLYTAQSAPGDTALKLSGKPAPVTPDPGLASQAAKLASSVAGPLAGRIDRLPQLAQRRLDERVQTLRKGGLLSRDNDTDPGAGLYQSDTGQLLLDSTRRRMTVITPKTEGVVFDVPEAVSLNKLSVSDADGPALVAVAAMDQQPLASSKRMLVVLASDARNTNMRFSDAAETTLADLGTGPVQIEARRVRLKLQNSHAATLRVYAVNLRGQRGDLIAVQRSGDSISFLLDTAALKQGPTTYFEVTAEE
ncbi:hypothetical protein GJ699_23855 [Duganella sp. FT80W]|uniref:Glycoside hydrolase n=1 Tax=Duganella guangzhouensis TaxID=2666084 RepID=A0A6I2L4H0_9BURK|nr:hypothetical protein [Duganella guangzhouensis]MRW93038.1 hypothetical protein [Duganella guangzhouensis]